MSYNARVLFVSGFISFFGWAFSSLITVTVYASFGRDFGWFFVALLLPPILFQRWFKLFLDTFDTKKSLVFVQASRGVLLLLQAIMLKYELLGPFVLCTFVFVQSLLHKVFVSALFVYIPRLIAEPERAQFLAKSGSWSQLGWGLGAAIFALTNTYFAAAFLLLVDCLAYGISVIIFAKLSPIVNHALPATTRVQGHSSSSSPNLLAQYLTTLSPLQLAFFIAYPMIVLKLFVAVTTNLAFSVPSLGATGLGLLDCAFRVGVVGIGFLYQGYIALSMRTYKAWLLLFLLLSSSLALLVVVRNHSLVSLFCAAMLGLVYGVMVTVSRSSLYTVQEDKGYSQVIVRTNMVDNIGGLVTTLATTWCMHHVGLLPLFIMAFALGMLLLLHCRVRFLH